MTCIHLTRTRVELEALYRKYFYEIHGFRPFPMELRYENVIDFLEWLQREAAHSPRPAPEKETEKR